MSRQNNAGLQRKLRDGEKFCPYNCADDRGYKTIINASDIDCGMCCPKAIKAREKRVEAYHEENKKKAEEKAKLAAERLAERQAQANRPVPSPAVELPSVIVNPPSSERQSFGNPSRSTTNRNR